MFEFLCPDCGEMLSKFSFENSFGLYCNKCGRYFTKTYQTQEMKENVKAELHHEICKELNELYRRKNADYGDSFHDMFLEEGMAMARIRLSDKLNRFKTLMSGNIQKVTDESIRDTLLDLANYAIMTVMEIDSKKD